MVEHGFRFLQRGCSLEALLLAGAGFARAHLRLGRLHACPIVVVFKRGDHLSCGDAIPFFDCDLTELPPQLRADAHLFRDRLDAARPGDGRRRSRSGSRRMSRTLLPSGKDREIENDDHREANPQIRESMSSERHAQAPCTVSRCLTLTGEVTVRPSSMWMIRSA